MNQPDAPLPHRIGVLSSLDPTDWQNDVVARVLRAHFELRRDDVSLDLRSIDDRVTLSRASWPSSRTAPWPTAIHAVIVDRNIAAVDRERAGASPTISIDTDMFADTMLWCPLFEQTLDTAAIDTRTRMLEHLGVDRDPTNGFARAADSLGGLLTLTDRYCLARAADLDALDAAHAALAGGRTESSSVVVDEITRVLAAIEIAAPGAIAQHSAALQQRAADLAVALGDERDRHALSERQAAEALDAAAVREHSLTERLETALLRSALQER